MPSHPTPIACVAMFCCVQLCWLRDDVLRQATFSRLESDAATGVMLARYYLCRAHALAG